MRSPLCSLPVGARPLLLLTAACTTIHTVQPAELSPPHPPARIWVTRADHSTVVFNSARVSADSLIGMVNGTPQRLPLSEAIVLRAREPSGERTAALVFMGVGGAIAALAVYAGAHGWLDAAPQGLVCGPDRCCPVSERPCG